MKFHLTRSGGRNLFTGYGEGYVAVNDQRFERHLLVAPDHAIVEWSARSFDALAPEHFAELLELKPEIVILGTGPTLLFPHPRITQPLAAASIGFEAMDTKAACRTYNILMAEGRQVVAAIFV
jgi:uncharacterized protein